MAQYLIVYFGGNPPATPEEGKIHMAAYKQWMASIGDGLVSPANPIKNSHTIEPGGNSNIGSATSMSGYTIIESESIENALKIAKKCPFLGIGGTLEVSELAEMPNF
ncbi:hypothetical protein [Vibrio tapetis]|uniref:YCII-related domain-containing protein n=1 Tax=Vibrio tapetis subsp. tapetis TaxID=1671868 RepID=A0A2N8Z9X0_9VIBR|nr:hypothetical protein [Vibrio tapetis]SON48700.1 conserved protein of unknown function [Vibrio tapetis subsp. tapetis]